MLLAVTLSVCAYVKFKSSGAVAIVITIIHGHGLNYIMCQQIE